MSLKHNQQNIRKRKVSDDHLTAIDKISIPTSQLHHHHHLSTPEYNHQFFFLPDDVACPRHVASTTIHRISSPIFIL